MVRKLKYHEKKLLKKVDFITWKIDNGGQENKILRRYHIRKRDDYTKYVHVRAKCALIILFCKGTTNFRGKCAN